MRKLGLILLLSALTVLLTLGCSDDPPKPSVTRLYASSTCGVAPLRVDFRADATGGAMMSDPTGGNNWLRMSWDFGDGTVIQEGTSIAFHEYADPDTYTVTVTVEDDNGERAQRQTEIVVQADSLLVQAYSLIEDLPVTEVEACRPLQLGIVAETCGFDPVEDSYERFVFRWWINGTRYTSPSPRHSFTSDDVGEQEITVVVEDPTRSITRFDTLRVDVLPSAGADLYLTNDWLLSPQGADQDTLHRDVPAFPDTLTYTIHLNNDGPADAYDLTVEGWIDRNNRCAYHEADITSGEIDYVAVSGGQTIKRWIWEVPVVTAGGSETADITFYVEMGSPGQDYEFNTSVLPYACDADTVGSWVRPVLMIETAP